MCRACVRPPAAKPVHRRVASGQTAPGLGGGSGWRSPGTPAHLPRFRCPPPSPFDGHVRTAATSSTHPRPCRQLYDLVLQEAYRCTDEGTLCPAPTHRDPPPCPPWSLDSGALQTDVTVAGAPGVGAGGRRGENGREQSWGWVGGPAKYFDPPKITVRRTRGQHRPSVYTRSPSGESGAPGGLGLCTAHHWATDGSKNRARTEDPLAGEYRGVQTGGTA